MVLSPDVSQHRTMAIRRIYPSVEGIYVYGGENWIFPSMVEFILLSSLCWVRPSPMSPELHQKSLTTIE